MGQPADRPIYFAVDVDVTAGQLAVVDAYLDGAASVLGRDRVGVYGEFDVVEHCLGGGHAAWGWQSRAWSHGRVSERAHLVQELGQVVVGGVECDVDTAHRTDFGQWSNREDDKDVKPYIVVYKKAQWVVAADLSGRVRVAGPEDLKALASTGQYQTVQLSESQMERIPELES